jgi:hypothetical protein
MGALLTIHLEILLLNGERYHVKGELFDDEEEPIAKAPKKPKKPIKAIVIPSDGECSL